MSADIAEVLRARGHRVTSARQAVWKALADASGHVTVEELTRRVREHELGVGDLGEQIRDHLDTGHGFRTATVELTVTGRCARSAGPG